MDSNPWRFIFPRVFLWQNISMEWDLNRFRIFGSLILFLVFALKAWVYLDNWLISKWKIGAKEAAKILNLFRTHSLAKVTIFSKLTILRSPWLLSMVTKWVKSLNGKWKFHWVKNPAARPKDFFEKDFDV